MTLPTSLRSLGRTALALTFSAAVFPVVAADKEPVIDPNAKIVPHTSDVFGADPTYGDKPYDAEGQIQIYGGKSPVETPRPLLELGRPLYTVGPLPTGFDIVGEKNLVNPSLQAYGDWRTAVAYNDNGANEKGQIATRLNLDVDLALTATERFHALMRPLDQGGQFTRYEFSGDDRLRGDFKFDLNVDTLFFEGDVGNIVAGLTDEYQSYDLPFTGGLIPMIFQNGVWVEDAIVGGAVAIPSLHSRELNIVNMDITFFGGFDKISNPGLRDDQNNFADHSFNVIGVATFIEANEGYWEAGVGHIDGEDGFSDLSFTSATVSFTRRYGGLISNSIRGIWSFGQDRDNGAQQTADGAIFLLENSLITHKPLTLVPYMNLFAGFDRPQSLLRDAGAGGVLKNTGINFETDGLTGFPKLDDSGQDTWGGAVGIQYLFNLDQQIVVEAASVQVIGDDLELGRPAPGNQYAVGLRYQLPLTQALILRADAMYGWLDSADDIAGARTELRLKF